VLAIDIWMILVCAYLHSNQPVVDQHFFGEKVGAYRRLVACTELLVDLDDSYKPLFGSSIYHNWCI
jgi:hypothetical protein